MWSLRSFLPMTSSTPSSTPLRPSFHDSNTRTEYCSIVSGCDVGTRSTAIWAPLRFSNSSSVCSSAELCWAFSVPVRSVTRVLSGGMSAAAAKNGTRSASSRRILLFRKPPAREARFPPYRGGRPESFLGAEVDRRGFGDRLLVLDRELRLRLVAEHHGSQVVRELTDQHVVVRRSLDEALAGDGDA